MGNAQAFALACIAAAGCYAAQVRADVVTDWNTVAGDLVAQAMGRRIGALAAERVARAPRDGQAVVQGSAAPGAHR
ncbi:hypothetical protein GCM10028796_21260 [Ramlibacter monticola]|uniref:Uncharacterized protein n=1 Tax=Ramlibacter monticola TaxID=1926872 RepID=A0A936Z003_9BURK|nr:hypothetical protein [Ramlibacter monticola]MBL0392379.1 hypothetical protein [Ramlibacter monticola]